MARSALGLDLGTPRDRIIFVDDWSGGDSSSDLSPVYFAGRSFNCNAIEELEAIRNILESGGAHEWHAARAGDRCLFTSSVYYDLIAAVDQSDSVFYDMLADRAQLLTAVLDEQAMELESLGLAKWWPKNSPYARGLLYFLTRLHEQIAQKKITCDSLLVVVDRLSWHSGRFPGEPLVRVSMPPIPDNNPANGVSMEVVAIGSKTDPASRPFLPFLGLVDSEAWAFGRIQQTRLTSGKVVRDTMQAWRDGGQPKVELFTAEDAERMRNSGHDRDEYRHYIDSIFPWWKADRYVSLGETD
jgi:hypothetical protein